MMPSAALGTRDRQRVRDLVGDGLGCLGGVEPHAPAEEIVGAEITEHQVAIGDGRHRAAAAVAGGARRGAGALRPDLERAEAVDRRDGAAARAHGVDVEHRYRQIAPFDLAAAGDQRLARLDQRHVARRAAHVEGDDVRESGRAAQMGARRHPAGRPRKHGGDGAARGGRERRHAAVRLHDVFLPRGDARLGQAPIELTDVAREDRLQIGVDDGRAQPIVLADLRQHLGRERDAAARHFLDDDLAHAGFVLRMEKREQQAHRDRIETLRGELACGFAQRRLVERPQHVAAKIDALLHLAGQARRHQRNGLVVHDVEDRGAIGAGLLADRIDAAKSFRHQQPGLGALAFQQRVGSDRGAMAKVADVGRRGAALEQRLDARQDRPRRIVGRRRELGDRYRAGGLVEIDEIRERPSGIDRDAETGHAITGVQPERSVPI